MKKSTGIVTLLAILAAAGYLVYIFGLILWEITTWIL